MELSLICAFCDKQHCDCHCILESKAVCILQRHSFDVEKQQYVSEILNSGEIKQDIKNALMFGPAFGLEKRLEEVLQKWFDAK